MQVQKPQESSLARVELTLLVLPRLDKADSNERGRGKGEENLVPSSSWPKSFWLAVVNSPLPNQDRISQLVATFSKDSYIYMYKYTWFHSLRETALPDSYFGGKKWGKREDLTSFEPLLEGTWRTWEPSVCQGTQFRSICSLRQDPFGSSLLTYTKLTY